MNRGNRPTIPTLTRPSRRPLEHLHQPPRRRFRERRIVDVTIQLDDLNSRRVLANRLEQRRSVRFWNGKRVRLERSAKSVPRLTRTQLFIALFCYLARRFLWRMLGKQANELPIVK